MQTTTLDEAFHSIHAFLMSLSPTDAVTISAAQNQFLSVATAGPMIMTDNTVKEVLAGNRDIYVLMSWRYRIPGDRRTFMKDFCGFYAGTFANSKICPGIHNGTFVAR